MVEIDACSVERVSDGEETVSDEVSDGEEKESDGGERVSGGGERVNGGGERVSDGDEKGNDDDEKGNGGDERESDGDEGKETIGDDEQHRVGCRSVCGDWPWGGRREGRRRRLWQRTRMVLVGEWTLACLCGPNMLYPLASATQILLSPSLDDGLPSDLELDLRAYGCKLIHQAGILLTQCVLVSSRLHPLTAPENTSPSPLPRSFSSGSGMSAR